MLSISSIRASRSAALLTAFVMILGAAQAQTAAPAQPKVDLDVPYVPTPEAVVDRMLEMAQVKSGDYVIDLGSGDGRIPIAAAKKYGVKAFGVDIDPKRIQEANENAKQAGVTDKVEFRQQDLFDTKIGDASVLTMYLLSSINMKLRPRILEELKPGTRVVSHAFNMGDWEPDQRDTVEGRNVYLWIVPAKVDGRWSVQDGERRFTVDLKQKFQELQGTASMDGQQMPISDARVRGEEVTFAVDMGGQRRTFTGRVEGDTITAAGGGSWRASRGS